MERLEGARDLRRIQRTALVLLIASGALNYVDRGALSVANPLIRHDLGLSVPQMGLLLSAFLWAYALAQLPAGMLIDRFGPRRMLAGGMTLWSLAQALCGAVASLPQFFAARILLGLGESPQSPASARVVRDWFELDRRGIATGLWNCSSTLGSALSVPVVTALMLWLGWRTMFVVLGILGVAMATALYVLHRDPRDVALSPEVGRRLTAGDTAEAAGPVTWHDWSHLFRFRTSWGMITGFFGAIYALWIYGAWLPAYLEMDRHMSVGRTGIVAAVPFLFGVAGSIGGGWVVDRLSRTGMRPIDARKYPMAASLVGTALCTVAAAEVPGNGACLAFISAAMFLIYVATSTAWALPTVAAPRRCTASLGAIQNFGGYVGGAIAPTATGFIVAASGSFRIAFMVGALVALASAAACLLLIGDPVPPAESNG